MSKKRFAICCGIQKSGTTTFFEYIRNHWQIAPSKVKELHFFDNEGINWANPDYSEYNNSFEENDFAQYHFEATPIYYFWPDAMIRLKKFAPDTKLILIFRDPFERAWSQYCMNYYRNDENLDFHSAITSGRKRLNDFDVKHNNYRLYTYIERGYYADKLKVIKEIFDDSQIFIANFEELKFEPQNLLNKVCNFLDIENVRIKDNVILNQRQNITYPSIPTYSDFEIVYNELNGQMREFSEISKLDISNWMTYSGNYGYTKQNLHKNG